jgi:hypothetical protein
MLELVSWFVFWYLILFHSLLLGLLLLGWAERLTILCPWSGSSVWCFRGFRLCPYSSRWELLFGFIIFHLKSYTDLARISSCLWKWTALVIFVGITCQWFYSFQYNELQNNVTYILISCYNEFMICSTWHFMKSSYTFS